MFNMFVSGFFTSTTLRCFYTGDFKSGFYSLAITICFLLMSFINNKQKKEKKE